jgi:dynein intermediate chain 2
MEAFYSYEKRRSDFGRPCKFDDFDSTILESRDSHEDGKPYIIQNPCVISLDTAQEQSFTTVTTKPVIRKDAGMQHTEGGWPTEIDLDDANALDRFRKKREKGTTLKTGSVVDPMHMSLQKLGPRVSAAVNQNNTMDIYEEYFGEYEDDHSAEPPSTKGMAVFRDTSAVVRTATQIDWQPFPSNSEARIAVSYSILKFQDPRIMNKSLPGTAHIWDISKPNTPETTFNTTSSLCCLKFNPKYPEVLVGGSYNGLVSIFDRRDGKSKGNNLKPTNASRIEKSHYDPIYDVHWTADKGGNLCVSCSTDGRMLFWDARKLIEPYLTVELNDGSDANHVMGACSMAYNPEHGPTKFLVGTEQGAVVGVNTRTVAKNGTSLFTMGSGKHHAPVTSIQKNPTFGKFFLTVGDWTARIWTEDLKTPIMTTKYHASYLTAGCWSPTRPGVFYVTRMDGVVDVWDYFYRQNDVALTHKVGDVPLSSISVHSGGSLIAIGDDQGSVSLLGANESLSRSSPHEKLAMQGIFDRETQREKNLMSLAKEKQRREHAAKKRKEAEAKEAEAKANQEEYMQEVEKKFIASVEASNNAEAGEGDGGGDDSGATK